MYQENNNTINWIKVIVKILLAFLVVILSVKLISLVINNKDKNNVENVMESNLTQMMEVAKDYFEEDKLPKQVGKSTKVDLETLIKDKKISTLKDSKGKECDLNESFIKATRLDKEYQIKAYLVCNKETDYLNEFIKIEDEKITIKATSTTTTKKNKTTKKTTTKKVTTTTKKKTTTTTVKKPTTTKKTTTKKVTTSTTAKNYEIKFNSNGGTSVSSVKVKENTKVNVPNEPIRVGYKFVGWYYHGVKFDFNTKVKQDYILVAKWTK